MGGGANDTICVVAQDPNATDPREIRIGSIVKAVYVEMWMMATSQQPATITTAVSKQVDGGSGINATEFTDLNGYANKKNIFELHQGLIGDANTNPVPFFRGWIKIPKGKQRMGLGDAIVYSTKAISEDVQYCGVFIYKVYN